MPDGVKLTAVAHIHFLKKNAHTCCKKKPLTFRKKMVFMLDNAPSHAAKKMVFMHDNAPYAAKLTAASLATVGFKCEILMTWPTCSHDLNPIENMWGMLKY